MEQAFGLKPGQVAELLVEHPGGERRGSGYRVAPGLVLTAAHVLADARRTRVRFEADRPGEYTVEAKVRWLHAGIDVALLSMPSLEMQDVATARFGRVGERDVVLWCSAAGFPRFKMRTRHDGLRFRDCEHVHASCSPLSNRREGTLDLQVAAPAQHPAIRGQKSPWEGMSGAAVFTGRQIIGVISRHHRMDGDGRLAACRVDRWAEVLTPGELAQLEALLGCSMTFESLPDVLGGASAERHQDDHQQKSQQQPEVPAHHLESYLTAAELYAEEHPYNDLAFGRAVPLTAVYLRRLATQRTTGPSGDHAQDSPSQDLTPKSAEEVLASTDGCVVLAGPGGGKSSLLHRCLAQGIRLRQQGDTQARIPVLVPAASLVGQTFTRALAAAATVELAPYGLLEDLPPQLFSRSLGVSWLVLVDGLDEIAEASVRRQVLSNLAMIAGGPNKDLFRFVVASRPLPDTELGRFDLQYVLEPFQHDDVLRLAIGWFTCLELSEPKQAATRFLEVVQRAKLAELVRSPLMATILCRLYAGGRDGELPGSRGDVYREFVELLDSGRTPPGLVRIRTHSRTSLAGRGAHALERVEHLLDRLPELITDVAAKKYGDRRVSPIEVLESLPDARRPPSVPRKEWRAFLEGCLRGSGLLTLQAGQLEFWHQTLLEYLAASHAISHPQTRLHTLNRLFGVEGRREHDQRAEISYAGFLVDIALASGDRDVIAQITAQLRRLVHQEELEGCRFVVQLVQLGTGVPWEVRTTCADMILGHLRADHQHAHMREELVGLVLVLGDPRALEMCADLVKDPSMSDQECMWAARALPRFGGMRGIELCLNIASDPDACGMVRVRAARALTGWHPRGADLCAVLTQDAHLDYGARVQAAKALARLGDARAVDLCATLGADPCLSAADRTRMARMLVDLGSPQAVDLYGTLARDTRLDLLRRKRIVRSLTRNPHAVGLCTELAADTALAPRLRVEAAQGLLTRNPNPSAIELCVALATDSELRGGHRVAAARALVRVVPQRGVELCREMASDPGLNPDARATVRQLLSEFDAARTSQRT